MQARGRRLGLRRADLASLDGRQALRDAQGTLSGALEPPPQNLLDLQSGLTNYTVLVWLLHFRKRNKELFELIYGFVLELTTLLLVVTLISVIRIV